MKVHIFDAGGRGHVILDALAHGPKYRNELFGLDRKAGYVLHALQRVGFVAKESGRHFLTTAGLEALANLDAGQEALGYEATPAVRVFARQEAA